MKFLMTCSPRLISNFPAVVLVLFCLTLTTQTGCETTDYRPVIFKKKIKELEDQVAKIKVNAVPADLVARIESLEKEVVQLRYSNAELKEAQAVSVLKASGAKWEINELTGMVNEVDLSTTRNNDSLIVLPDFSALESIKLNGTQVDPRTFTVLGKCVSLQRIELEKAPVTVAGLKKLRSLKNLKYLQLFRSDVSDEGLAIIAEMNGLEQLRCGQTRVGDDGVKHLVKLKSLKAIDLSDCNRVSDLGLETLGQLPELSFVKVWGPQITDEGMKSLGQLKSLRVLGLNDTAVTDEGIAELANCKELAEIHLFRTAVGDKGIEVLADLPKMKYFNLRDTRISDESLKMLAEVEGLEKLDLSEASSPGVTNASAECFAKMTNLKELNLWATAVGDEVAKELGGLKSLTRLNLDKTKLTNEGVKEIAKLTQLTWLHIGSNQIDDEAGKGLLKLANLKYLNISKTQISDDLYFELDDTLAPKGGVVIGP